MKLFLVLALLFPPVVFADTIAVTPMSGTLTGLPSETVNYNFTVTSTLSGQFVTDALSGSALITPANGSPYTEIFDPSNTFTLLAANDSLVIAEFGVYAPTTMPYEDPYAKYDFIATGFNQTELVFSEGTDPQIISTDEPSVLLLGLAGLLYFSPRYVARWRYRTAK